MSETLVRSLILIAGFLPAGVVYARTAVDGPLVTSRDVGSYSGLFAPLALIISLQGSAEPFSEIWNDIGTYGWLILVGILLFLFGLLIRTIRKTFGSDFHALLYFFPGDRERILTTTSEVLVDFNVDSYRENGRIYLRKGAEKFYFGVWCKGFENRILYSNDFNIISERERVPDAVRRRYRRGAEKGVNFGFLGFVLVFLLAEAQILFEFL